jgi:type II secretory pathway component PulM
MMGQIEAGAFFRTRRQAAGLLLFLAIVLMAFGAVQDYVVMGIGIILFLVALYFLLKK